jgi:hypothetical protein
MRNDQPDVQRRVLQIRTTKRKARMIPAINSDEQETQQRLDRIVYQRIEIGRASWRERV